MSDTVSKALPDKVNKIRELVSDVININTDISDSFLAEIYTAARKCKSQNFTSLANNLSISYKKLAYYRDNSPAVASVIRAGFIDGRADMEEKLTKTLYDSAVGNISTVDEQTDEEAIIDYKTGLQVGTNRRKKTVVKQVAPNTNAALELLKKLNPEDWVHNPKFDVSVNDNRVMNVVENRNINIDYRNLSPEALQELIDSEAITGTNLKAWKREDGTSVKLLKEYRENNKKEEPILNTPIVEKPNVKTTASLTPKKLKTALDIGYAKSSKEAAKEVKKEKIAKISSEINKEKKPRGRPKKVVDSTAIEIKRPRGRPKKIKEENN